MSDPFVGVGGGENWDQSFAGGGPVDTASQIVKSFQDSDWLAFGGNIVAAGLDVLSVVDSPLDAIGTSALGWFIEHVRFLDGFLDNTVGDPVAIDNAAAALSKAAVELDGIAAEQFTAFDSEINVYRAGVSPSKVPFEERVGPRAEELKLLSVQCEGLGRALITAGLMVSTIRGIMRDLLAEFAWWVLQRIAIAMATAPYSGGASVGVALTDTVRSGVQTGGKLATLLEQCLEKLAALNAKVKQLAELMSTPRRATAAVALQNLLPSTGKAIDDTAQSYQPSAYDKAREEAEPPPEPAELEPKVPEPEVPFGPVQQRSPAWQTSGTLDEP
jgi:hypothetical protein